MKLTMAVIERALRARYGRAGSGVAVAKSSVDDCSGLGCMMSKPLTVCFTYAMSILSRA